MKKTLFIICLFFLQYGCSSDGTGNNESDTPNNPSIANLVFPFENSLCNEGTNITPTESTVLFEWEASDHTNSYKLELKNLSTGNLTTHQTTATEIPIVLKRGTPYVWYVISESNSVIATAQSAIWQFYNAGEGFQSYAPFPAVIISPAMAETIITAASEITLDWNGNDVDEDIIGYDVYFDTVTPPSLFVSDLNESILNNVPITPDTIYYWKIITKDSQGNSSDSGIYQFKIQ